MCELSYVQLSATPWTIAYQAPLSVEFSRQECWSGLQHFLPHDTAYMQNLTKGINKLIYKSGVTDVENKRMVTRGRVNWEVGTDIYTRLYMKQTVRTCRIAQPTGPDIL